MQPVTATWVLVVILILLPTIAFASVPDPIWIPGMYDKLDGDDAVTLVAEIAASEGEIGYARPDAASSEEVLIREAGECENSPALHASRRPPQRRVPESAAYASRKLPATGLIPSSKISTLERSILGRVVRG